MLNVRVFVESGDGARSMIWEGARPETYPGQEDRALQRWNMLAADPAYVGRVFDMRFTNGDDSGCRVEGALVAAHVEGAQRVDVVFAGDKYRVW